jgi:hypothetical protein
MRFIISACVVACLFLSAPANATARHGQRPAGCPERWCGCWLALHKGISDHRLWVARAWANWGRPSPLIPGAVVVYPHHVVEVLSALGNGRFIGVSGNDGHAVRVRERSTARAIAIRS